MAYGVIDACQVSSKIRVKVAIEERVGAGGRHGQYMTKDEQRIHQLSRFKAICFEFDYDGENGQWQPAEGENDGYASQDPHRSPISPQLSMTCAIRQKGLLELQRCVTILDEFQKLCLRSTTRNLQNHNYLYLKQGILVNRHWPMT